jgi:hypothetical protein
VDGVEERGQMPVDGLVDDEPESAVSDEMSEASSTTSTGAPVKATRDGQ